MRAFAFAWLGATPGQVLLENVLGRCKTVQVAAVTVLDREMYTEAEAARLLRLAPATLHYWLEGGTKKNRTYKPIIRVEATGSKTVTWAEFIEAGLVRQYRRIHQVPMIELRSVIEYLRDQLGFPYPLAHATTFVAGRQIVVAAQDQAGLDPDFALVAPVSGQYLLMPAAEAFYQRVTWADDATATAWRPDERAESPVTIDPDIRFGSPSIGGIRTSTLYEQSESGEDEEDLAETFSLTVAQVRWALSFELANNAA